MIFDLKKICLLIIALAPIGLGIYDKAFAVEDAANAEARGVEFLTREVPAWSKDNGCYSCHNNGDGARALYLAGRKGYRIPANVLADTTAWIAQPSRWDQNKGDPGFSDKRLANIQFGAVLLTAIETGRVKDRAPLEQAARKLVMDQDADGSWKIDVGNTLGSPATYGTPLATVMALRVLKKAGLSETADAIKKAEHWLGQTPTRNIPTAAALLLVAVNSSLSAQGRQDECLKLIRAAQTRDGGWGPYADSPPEPFDTAIALLALAQLRRQPGVDEMIRRGRSFLVAEQKRDGSWPATTRPPGGDSYAQMISTTGWVTLALLETKDRNEERIRNRRK